MSKGIPKNQVKSINTIHQSEHCDDADARRVKLVDETGEPFNSSNPVPVIVPSGTTVDVRLFDELGAPFTLANPLPVELSDGSVNIGTVNAEIEVQLSHQNNVPDAGDVADSVQVGNGTNILAISSDGSINTRLVEPITATPSTENPVGTTEVEISPIAGQNFIILSPTTAGNYHYRLATGVTTNSVPFTRRQPAIISDWAGSVFVRKATGSGTLEVTQG